MLVDFMTRRRIESMPHADSYRERRQRLSDADHEAIMQELYRIMDETPKYFVSSFLPGEDWTGTVFCPIYLACNQDEDDAKLFYGQLVWEAVQNHSSPWAFSRVNYHPDRIYGLTCFRYEDEIIS